MIKMMTITLMMTELLMKRWGLAAWTYCLKMIPKWSCWLQNDAPMIPQNGALVTQKWTSENHLDGLNMVLRPPWNHNRNTLEWFPDFKNKPYPDDPYMMNNDFKNDAQMTPRWYPADPILVSRWFQHDTQLIPKWYPDVPKMIPICSQNYTQMTPKWYTCYLRIMPRWPHMAHGIPNSQR